MAVKSQNSERVLVAMSGGVDSSVAAYLLKEQGFDVVGITFQLYDYSRQNRKEGKGGCCSIEDVDDAKLVADQLGIRHYMTNSRENFRGKVIDYFVSSYKRGLTPNPCVACNTFIKFDELTHYANILGAKYVATGHYARLVPDNGRVYIERAVNEEKDQSYYLMGVDREKLKNVLFPCGHYTKEEIRQFAEKAGLCVSQKKDSMEVCFITNNDYRSFLKKEGQFEDRPGEIVDTKGKHLGTHQGIHHFTIGQRRGLGALGLNAHYVVSLDTEANRVVVGASESLLAETMEVETSQFQDIQTYLGRKLLVKIRSRSPYIPVELKEVREGKVLAKFERPQRAVTPGQFAVFYQDARVVGGGAIVRSVAE